MKRKSESIEVSDKPGHKEEEKNTDNSKERFERELAVLFIENSIKFDTSNNFHLKRLVSRLAGIHINEIPSAPKLLFHVNDMYNNFQGYFKGFFAQNRDRLYSLTLNKWNNDYGFFNIQFMNDEFKYFEFPLGLFRFQDGRVDNGIIRNTILQDLTGKINFITTNFELDLKSKNIIKFLLNSNQTDKILMCFPSFLVEAYLDFLKSYSKADLQMIKTLDTINFSTFSNVEKINRFYETVCKEMITKLTSIEVEYLKEIDFEEKQQFLKDSNHPSLVFRIRNMIYFKKFLKESDYNQLNSFEWQLIEFFTYITTINLKLVEFPNRVPLSNHLLQLIKYEIFLMDQMYQQFPLRYNLLSPVIFKSFEAYSGKLDSYHRELSAKPNILLSTYLSPHTRKFLKSEEIQSIRSLLKSSREVNVVDNSNDTEDSFSLDGLIMDAFECSGNINNEVLVFETIETKKPPDLTKFWNTNKVKFPNLAKLAKEVLPIQINSDRNNETFKSNFQDILGELKDDICSIEAYCFIYFLSQEIDLIAMDSMEKNIEEFQHDVFKSHKCGTLVNSRDLKLPEL
ncbi:hypothetical protein CLIB1444_03S03004 [[Candida] jaroonii]|uniref:Uncharacterized protein n=1 Tax=[Candida] jaroonii TaxID=467808 RepID=A0ACA9Y572_9ASCO|nr:hypothetical protein CLIB1444_03S03004 [[Candida] jaroonii]